MPNIPNAKSKIRVECCSLAKAAHGDNVQATARTRALWHYAGSPAACRDNMLGTATLVSLLVATQAVFCTGATGGVAHEHPIVEVFGHDEGCQSVQLSYWTTD